MVRRTRKNLKWSVIAIATILTFTAIFSGDIYCVVGLIPLFWVYVILDKFNHVTKRAKIDKLYKNEKF